MSVVCIYDIFENNFGNKHRLTKYMKESCGLGIVNISPANGHLIKVRSQKY